MLSKIEDHTVNQRYADYVQPANQDVFRVIDTRARQLSPEWTKGRVLDFGCNIGHLLSTSDGALDPSRYVGIDVNQKALEIAKQAHPTATWVWYDAYNPTFNPSGVEMLPPDLGSFDTIVVYGVFTHCCLNEIKRLMEHLRTLLRPGGIMLFSIWENTQFPGYVRFLRSRFGISVKLAPYRYEYMYLLNRSELLKDSPDLPLRSYDWVETFYKRRFMLKEFPDAQVLQGFTTLHVVYALQAK